MKKLLKNIQIMKAEQLLTSYPKTTEIVRKWFTEKMVASMTGDSASEEAMIALRENGIPDIWLIATIEASPRGLFDVFDEHYIYVYMVIQPGNEMMSPLFTYGVLPRDLTPLEHKWYESRREAEYAAIEDAFKILNERL